jgi:hypothetical protein
MREPCCDKTKVGSSTSDNRQDFGYGMRKVLLVFLLIAACAFAATNVTEFEGNFTQKTGAATQEIFHDWRPLSILAIAASIVLVAIAYAIGIGMETPEIKAWAGSELVQAFTNLVIIAVLMATIALLDVVAQEMVQSSGLSLGAGCTGGQSCLGTVADMYLASYIDTAKADAKSIVVDSISYGGWTGRRFGLTCTSILCLQIGASGGFTGNYLLDQDRLNLVFEYYSNLMASLEAQRFFLGKVGFNIGPLLLAAGIVARSFFFTRKVGGLLMAVAIGIMFFLPGMYVFDWLTLDTTLTGDKANTDAESPFCPEECKTPHAWAVVEDGSAEGIKLGSIKMVYDAFPDAEAATADSIISGAVASAVPGGGGYAGKTVISCMHDVSVVSCPLACRELPYPTSLTQCMNLSANVPQNCAALPDKCWVRRLATPRPPEPGEKPPLSMCPFECRVVPPLKGNCNTGNCLTSRPECRIYERNGTGFVWSPNPPKEGGEDQYNRCLRAQDCAPNADAYLSCSYIVPETGSCTPLCQGCPEVCRVTTGDISKLPTQCINASDNKLLSTCQSCPVGCKANATHIAAASEAWVEAGGEATCVGCGAEKRILTYGETMPADYITGACDINTKCKAEDRVPIPRNSCEQCIFSEESEMYTPPIQTGCMDLCKPSDDFPLKSPGAYTGIGGEGLVGTPEIQNVSKLMLPAYVLPLFNIVATLVFIKGLSTILGGDIEIPGISKVF